MGAFAACPVALDSERRVFATAAVCWSRGAVRTPPHLAAGWNTGEGAGCHRRVTLQVHLGCGAGPLRQQPGQGGVETPVSAAGGAVLGLCCPPPLPCRCPALMLSVAPAAPASCLPPAPAPVLLPGCCPADPAPLLPAEDLLLPCLRPPARHGQPRRWHPHTGQEEERPPGLPEPALPPAPWLRQPRCGHPHNGQARAAPWHHLPRLAGLPCGHGRPADSGTARC